MTVTNERETLRQTGAWRLVLIPVAIAIINIACFVVQGWTNDAKYNWMGRYVNECGKLIVFPWTMTVPLNAALALSSLSIVVTAVWFIRRRKAENRRGCLTILTALLLVCFEALTVGLILLNMHSYAHSSVSCGSGV